MSCAILYDVKDMLKRQLQFNVNGLKHVLGTENLVELFLGEQVVLEDKLVDTATGFTGFLCNLSGLLIAYDGVEHGNYLLSWLSWFQVF